MANQTEQEEQEMIDRAKAGDPEANFQMYLWAMEQEKAEPEEERWDRLAAKCLIRAADAGYAPAVERMDQLIHDMDEDSSAQPSSGPETYQREGYERSRAPQDRDDQWGEEQTDTRPRLVVLGGAAIQAIRNGAKRLVRKGKRVTGDQRDYEDEYGYYDEEAIDEESVPARRSGSHTSGRSFFSRWGHAKLKKLQIICVVAIVLIIILIVILLATRKSNKDDEETTEIPAADVAETPEPTSTPYLTTYPDDDTIAEIAAASLDVYPNTTDLVTEPTTATVTATNGLNLRKGPASSYDQVALMEQDTQLEVFAYRDDWALVRFNGTTWGWCSTDYLR